jgi:hypothetical protein
MVDGSKPIEIDQPETQEHLVDLYQDSGEAVEVDLNQLLSVPENLGLRLLSSLKAKPRSWLLVAAEYVRVGRVGTAEELLAFAIESKSNHTLSITNLTLTRASYLFNSFMVECRQLLKPKRPKSIRPDRCHLNASLPPPSPSSNSS